MLDDVGQGTALHGAVAAPDGGAFVVGSFRGGYAHDFDDDILVARFGPAGERLWLTRIGGKRRDGGGAIAASRDALYVVGWTRSSRIGQSVSHGKTDVVLARLDFEGQVVWTRLLGDSHHDAAWSVALEGHGVVVAGESTFRAGNSPCGFGPAVGYWYVDAAGTVLADRRLPLRNGRFGLEGVVSSSPGLGTVVGGRTFPCVGHEPGDEVPFLGVVGRSGRMLARFRPPHLRSIEGVAWESGRVCGLGQAETERGGFTSYDATVECFSPAGRLRFETNLRIPDWGTIGYALDRVGDGFVVAAAAYSQTGNPDRNPNRGVVVRVDGAGHVVWRFTLSATKHSFIGRAAGGTGAIFVAGYFTGSYRGVEASDDGTGLLLKLPD